MTNPTNHPKWLVLGLVVLVLLLAACVRPVVTDDPTTTSPDGAATLAPLPPTAVPDFLPSPTPPDLQPTPVPEQPTAVPPVDPVPESTAPPSGGAGTVYTVRAGENLFRIGLQNGCTVDQMSQANNIVYPYTIFPGQQLIIPAC